MPAAQAYLEAGVRHLPTRTDVDIRHFRPTAASGIAHPRGRCSSPEQIGQLLCVHEAGRQATTPRAAGHPAAWKISPKTAPPGNGVSDPVALQSLQASVNPTTGRPALIAATIRSPFRR
ncbi:hypothetical protein [Mycobacterium sp.]|uniref:hypothetical protein n=1 Tax=Mycobacterium sp. TaxID=1785 RepID=UPI0011F8EED9|nr:hypothetical protein [Mycobacterium sp.]TAM62854.1 MAG: hypothetical protein EPN51_28900 [Mycobacterium sp.]